MTPLFSIITSTFNAAEFLDENINSIRNSTFKDFEFIVIDGGSTDATLEIIKSNTDVVTKFISEPDTGIYNAWNKGVKLARGKWILFVGADDRLLPESLELYTRMITQYEYTDIDYVSAKVKFVGKNGSFIRDLGGPWKWRIFKKYMCVAHVASLHSKDFFDKYGLFNESFKIVGDYELLLRAKNNLKALFLNEFVAVMRDGGVSNNADKAIREALEAKKINQARNEFNCFVDYNVAKLKYKIRAIFFQ